MRLLKIQYYLCNGLKSCGECENALPGFVTKHAGELMVSDKWQKEQASLFDLMVTGCPKEAISFDEM